MSFSSLSCKPLFICFSLISLYLSVLRASSLLKGFKMTLVQLTHLLASFSKLHICPGSHLNTCTHMHVHMMSLTCRSRRTQIHTQGQKEQNGWMASDILYIVRRSALLNIKGPYRGQSDPFVHSLCHQSCYSATNPPMLKSWSEACSLLGLCVCVLLWTPIIVFICASCCDDNQTC